MPRARTRRRTAPAPAVVPRSLKWYGWIPDLPDHRDRMFSLPSTALAALPSVVDLRAGCPPVYDQGQLGSCTSNAIAGALEFDRIRQQMDDVFLPSRLFIYYNERVIEGTVAEDAGAMLRDGIKSVATQGAPHETLWPYVIAKFSAKPSKPAYTDGAKHPALLYQRVQQDLQQMQGCLASGFPFVFGFSVYDSFESAAVTRSGDVPMPRSNEQQLGGHAMLAVGYDESSQRFTVRNSWGARWGRNGYGTMPFQYLLDDNLSADFWTISLVQ